MPDHARHQAVHAARLPVGDARDAGTDQHRAVAQQRVDRGRVAIEQRIGADHRHRRAGQRELRILLAAQVEHRAERQLLQRAPEPRPPRHAAVLVGGALANALRIERRLAQRCERTPAHRQRRGEACRDIERRRTAEGATSEIAAPPAGRIEQRHGRRRRGRAAREQERIIAATTRPADQRRPEPCARRRPGGLVAGGGLRIGGGRRRRKPERHAQHLRHRVGIHDLLALRRHRQRRLRAGLQRRIVATQHREVHRYRLASRAGQRAHQVERIVVLDACGDRRVISAGTPCMPVPVQQVDEHRRRLVRQDPPQQQALFAIAQRPAGADALQVGVIDQHHGDRVGSVVERRGDPQDRLLGALPRTGTRIQRVHHQQRQEAERDQHARPPRRHGRRGGRARGARRRWRRIVQRFPGPRGRWRVSGCGLVPRRGWSEANTGVDPPARRDAVHVVPDRDAASSSVCDLSREPEPVAS